MKFADGFWLNQRGYEVNYANQAFEIEEIENGFLVVATPFVVYNRAMMLGSANLEIAYTSTQENCVKVSITHHKGHVDNGPHFVLEDKGFKPQVTVTDKEPYLLQATQSSLFLRKTGASHTIIRIRNSQVVAGDRQALFRECLQAAGKTSDTARRHILELSCRSYKNIHQRAV